MPHRQVVAFVALGLLVWALPVSTAPGRTRSGAQVRFSSRTLGVRVDVLVTDGHAAVPNLTAGDFELRDNGVVQKVEVIEASDVPISAVLALDTSASIAGKRQQDLIGAGDALLDGLTPIDRAALTTFSHAVTPPGALTSDIKTVRAALHGIVPEGLTAVMDGAYVALTATLGQPGRFLLVVCTDGSDTSSWLQPSEVVEAAKRSNAVIYAVSSAEVKRSEGLKQLTDVTGGQMFTVKSSTELRSTFQRILTEFRNRYVLAYEPAGVTAGGFHKIEVTVPRRRVTVKARPGYAGTSSGTPR